MDIPKTPNATVKYENKSNEFKITTKPAITTAANTVIMSVCFLSFFVSKIVPANRIPM